MSIASSAADRRLHPREEASEAVRLVTASGYAHDARVVDRSLRGLRIEFDPTVILPGELTVLSRSAGAAYVAAVVWRSGAYTGLAIARTVDMRAAPGPGAADLHKLWREHING